MPRVPGGFRTELQECAYCWNLMMDRVLTVRHPGADVG